jgi:hypothetical protein
VCDRDLLIENDPGIILAGEPDRFPNGAEASEILRSVWEISYPVVITLSFELQ